MGERRDDDPKPETERRPRPGVRPAGVFRAAVVGALAALAPEWPIPPDGRTVAQCLAALPAGPPLEPRP